MTGATYNVWANYPTWAVSTWLGSEESSHTALEQTVRSWDSRTASAGGTLSELADALRELVENLSAVQAARAEATLASDLLAFALSSVDWLELAQCTRSASSPATRCSIAPTRSTNDGRALPRDARSPVVGLCFVQRRARRRTSLIRSQSCVSLRPMLSGRTGGQDWVS